MSERLHQVENVDDHIWSAEGPRPIAHLAWSTGEFSEKTGVSFKQTEDDLGVSDYAFTKLPDGKVLLVRGYTDVADSGTIIETDAMHHIEDVQRSLSEFYDLHDEDFTWKLDPDSQKTSDE